MDVCSAPLTMDEAREYTEVIPNCDETTWLSTGWGALEHRSAPCALCVYTEGDWDDNYCSLSYGICPALVIPSSLLDPESDKTGLEDVSTEVLLEEIRRRANGS